MSTSNGSKSNLKHIALIMDGNGRWAKAHSLKRFMGHKRGIEIIEDILSSIYFEHHIFCCSLYAFSLDNFKRPQEEIDYLFMFLVDFLKSKRKFFLDNDIKVVVSGELEDDRIPQDVKKEIKGIMDVTRECKSYILNLLFAYSGRKEILNATNKVLTKRQNDIIYKVDIHEDEFLNYLQTGFLPPVDLLIRTSGEKRISDCLLYSIAYAEFVFIDECWPDFNTILLKGAIEEYYSRKRRYGGVA